MLIGIPGSGKSTWVKQAPLDWNNTVIASTDNYIERQAARQNLTYSEVFASEISAATRHMNQTIHQALEQNQNIVWDQTNLTSSARRHKLKTIPDHYKKIAVVLPKLNNTELKTRLDQRPGKQIPDNVLEKMIRDFEPPSEREGFDQIIWV